MASIDYWLKRLTKYGHTGWANKAIYYYDQTVRLKLVDKVLDSLGLDERSVCLDYGCGVGDFSRLLAERGFDVIGYDISQGIVEEAARRSVNRHLLFTSDPSVVENKSCYDLVVSVTVLQHIVSEHALVDVVGRLVASLKSKGYLVMLESMSAYGVNAGHLKIRSEAFWVDLLAREDMELCTRQYVFHPIYNPTNSFKNYYSRWIVKFFRISSHFGISLFDRAIKKIAENSALNDEDFSQEKESPMVLLVFKKASK